VTHRVDRLERRGPDRRVQSEHQTDDDEATNASAAAAAETCVRQPA
jgi:hypothetical protein